MKTVIVISGVAGMTGNELARQYLLKGCYVIGFDNFFASSKESIADILPHKNFTFFEYDINNTVHMNHVYEFLQTHYSSHSKNFINCAAVVHTKHFYHINDTFTTNVLGMKRFLDLSIKLKAKTLLIAVLLKSIPCNLGVKME